VILRLGGALIGGVVVAVLWWNRATHFTTADHLTRAQAAFEESDFAAARRQAALVLKRDSRNVAALRLDGKCLEAIGRSAAAARAFAKVPDGHRPFSCEAGWRRGRIQLMSLGQPAEAEQSYRRALRDDPESIEAHQGLAVVYGLSGQWWRQIPHRLAMIRADKQRRVDLFSMALAENSMEVSLDVARLRQVSPDDPLVLLAAARLAVEEEEYQTAATMLQSCIRTVPELFQAHVRLGELYHESGNEREFQAWSRSLPAAANAHPTTWVLRGKWALIHSTPEVALRCFCEAIERDANQPDALYQAGQILTAMRRDEDASPFLQRSRILQEFLNTAKIVDADDDLMAMQRVAALAEKLGNTWEAYGWSALAMLHPQQPAWAKEAVGRMRPRLAKLALKRTEAKFNPTVNLDYRLFPLPSISAPEADSVPDVVLNDSLRRFSFDDQAAAADITFQYFNGSRAVQNGMKYMYEVIGGGVAVLDVNCDLQPDLYFTQGCHWPVDETRFEHLDRLYVNQGDQRFVDVTESCGIRENRFSQGVSAGDFDSDGFPDLLVANIGRNRLYRNNGDGTFSDVSVDVGFTRDDWTTSCAISDLTGDGHPELYLVNYLSGTDVFTRTCGEHGQATCLPQHFDAADDRLFWNAGDGSFQDVTESSGITVADGKGLGIAVASFDGSNRPHVFIANDTVMNSYFVNQTVNPDGPPRFREQALITGLAMNAAGRVQACMGVAAGDADGDGEAELFVTNFHGEANSYYQLSSGAFQEVAMKNGLRQPSLSKLGFGTQFLDANLDGWLDLLIANGHIDDFSEDGRTEYQMQPQFMANIGKGRFREVDSSTLGRYFESRFLGRALARLDWNGDGREDAVVSHLDAPVALLTNTVQEHGGFVTLRLRGVQSSRDAIGSIVQVQLKDRTITRQLMAGDGFHASNERSLVFGLGVDKVVQNLTVRWPSGRREEFTQLPVNTHWIAIEGAGELFQVDLR